MADRETTLEELASDIERRGGEIIALDKQIRGKEVETRELRAILGRLRDEQASDTARLATMARAIATRPPSPMPTVGTAMASVSGISVASPSAVASDDDDPSRPTGRKPSRERRRSAPTQQSARVPNDGEGREVMTGRAAKPRIPGRRPGQTLASLPPTFSRAKLQAIFGPHAVVRRKPPRLGFRHLEPLVRHFSVIRPAPIPLRGDPTGRAPKGFTAAVRALAHRSIRRAGRPLNRGEIVDIVSRSGMPLPTYNLAQKVGKILLEDEELVNVRGAGYIVRTRLEP